MKKISISDISFVENSLIDPVGRVFFYNENYYRIIYGQSEKEIVELLDSQLFEELIKGHYIPETTIADDIEVEGVPLVLKHERCYNSMSYEWSFEMLRDAAVHILKLNELCNKYGYWLKDGHPMNITFHNGKPVFLDFGSIVKRKDQTRWVAEEEFLQRFYLPLMLWSKGEFFLFRTIVESNVATWRLQPSVSFDNSQLARIYLGERVCYKLRRRMKVYTTKKEVVVSFVNFLNKVIGRVYKRKNHNYRFVYVDEKWMYIRPSVEKVLSLRNNTGESDWMNYYQEDTIIKRFPRIIELLKKYCSDATTATDLAGNRGLFAEMLLVEGIAQHVFVLDRDANAVDGAYQRAKTRGLCYDAVWTNMMCPVDESSSSKRFMSDIAIALALTHHLVLTQGYDISLVLERLSAYSNKYVVVEFMPLGLWDGTKEPSVPSWYTEEWFLSHFSERFTLLHKEQLEENRIVFIGVKR
ncbi:MAG: hypothetical protein J6P83_10100 [Bacteroidales bacterium]|nr:hypothetical protein [Bacteroidales bacterium]